METLLEYERNLFLWLNGSHTPFLDAVMWFFAGIWIWLPTLLVPLYFVWKKKRRSLSVVLAVTTVVVCSLCVSAYVFKPAFARFRPTTHPAFMHSVTLLNDYHAGGPYGFISGHTTTAFGFAVFSMLLIRRRAYSVAILCWAALMGYSRIYLGAHFISDVIAGLLTGVLLGWLTFRLHRRAALRSTRNALSGT
ncbi:MAG: phosphatase PAP2 family protein [Tannerella sp.]|jgi:undecaprenyl-diphosphatase|nr:phosphatase PAP2 family protein [Tannerella sp.]